MLDSSGTIIYIGKAKNLKKRVSSYFLKTTNLKTRQLQTQIDSIQITITNSETEAYLLENQLISKNKPKYNIIFKDDKTYPYIKISNEYYPQISFYRGKIDSENDYFGPFPSSNIVKESLNILFKIFRLRQCDSVYFKSRKRPCLQYQIKRCSAPCVNLIKQYDYIKDIDNAKLFLSGKTNKLILDLQTEMDDCAKEQKYEQAAAIRDKIKVLQSALRHQIVVSENITEKIDVIGIAVELNNVCIHVLKIREGIIYSSLQYFSKLSEIDGNISNENILEKFLLQNYVDNNDLPNNIIVPVELENINIINSLIKCSLKGRNKKLLALASQSAIKSLEAKLHPNKKNQAGFLKLEKILKLEHKLKNIECFDISHTSGKETVGVCISFNNEIGINKENFRKYNIKYSKASDDYGAMKESLERHYGKLSMQKELLPELLVIDGGKGQLKVAENVLRKLNIDSVKIISIAKGEGRKSGLETIYLNSKGDSLNLDINSSEFKLLQKVRDESHRFAITSHRKKRAKTQFQSILEKIPGIGPKKRLSLLRFFAGIDNIKQASIEELSKAPGISYKLAEKIYNNIHGQ